MDALQALRFLEGKGVYDCIFMDPPYEKGLEAQVLEYLSGSSLVDENTLLIVEADLKQISLMWNPWAIRFCALKNIKRTSMSF